MQGNDRILARRYARALFAAARERHAEEKIASELGEALPGLMAAELVCRDPRTQAPAKEAAVVKAVVDRSPLLRHFALLLLRRKRMPLLPLIAEDIRSILDAQRGVISARVATAKPLSAEERGRLEKILEKLSGRAVALEAAEDPALLGGIQVRVGDAVYERSLRADLARLKEVLDGHSS
jgi:F-type H+-transporting ATPase subunit delta